MIGTQPLPSSFEVWKTAIVGTLKRCFTREKNCIAVQLSFGNVDNITHTCL